MVQRLRLEAPDRFVCEGPRTQLAAAEIEDLCPVRAGAAHHLPVHEVVRSATPRLLEAAAVVRQYLVAETEADDTAQRCAATHHREHFAGRPEHLQESAEVGRRVKRGSKITNPGRKDPGKKPEVTL